MKQVEFHHGMDDKLAYAFRLLRKAYRSGSRVVVTADAATLRQLDKALWVKDELDFLPHVCQLQGQSVPTRLHPTPLWLTDTPTEVPGRKQVLINLGATIPEGIEPYDRFFEVVSTQAEDRQLGRSRWREYEGRGWMVKAHVAQAES